MGEVLGDTLQFDHVEMYVDKLRTLEEYKKMETEFNAFTNELELTLKDGDLRAAVPRGKEIWQKHHEGAFLDPAAYCAANQDPVEQLITAMGWRITAAYSKDGIVSYQLTSSDPSGAVFICTAKAPTAAPPAAADGAAAAAAAAADGSAAATTTGDDGKQRAKRVRSSSNKDAASAAATAPAFPHFTAARLEQYFHSHHQRQGFAVLSFRAPKGGVKKIHNQYQKLFPTQLLSPNVTTFGRGAHQLTMTEVYAYRLPDFSGPDHGTVIRYIERSGSYSKTVLPGLDAVTAEFGGFGTPCYSDHWVSNVVDRKDFLSMMQQVLGFTPKVDFNAGVVGAGEAVIESTVTGNNASSEGLDVDRSLVNQAQIYLPTNNALSEFGHVHLYLKEIGQGIQHIACRVRDLVGFINRANAFREITGQGFTFLRIPRSYYGRLTETALTTPLGQGASGSASAATSADLAKAVMATLIAQKKMTTVGIVSLDISDEQVAALEAALPAALQAEFRAKLQDITAVVKQSRFVNLFKLLRNHLSEESYLKVVQNQVLVDIQGQDVLYQIFTSNVMQRVDGEEAPFYEFIQRLCSEKKDDQGKPRPVRPGCGGFGIRNFLTLFLSIEVSKAMNALEAAKAKNDAKEIAYQEKVIDIFTTQMEESNPILTGISDAMTAEGEALERLPAAKSDEEREAIQKEVEKNRQLKESGQEKLKVTSEHHKSLMTQLRSAHLV